MLEEPVGHLLERQADVLEADLLGPDVEREAREALVHAAQHAGEHAAVANARIEAMPISLPERTATSVGSLTPREAGRIERQESKINKEVRQDRKENGGNLTNKEKAKVNRQQNRVSKEIYNQKHDDQTQK